MAPKKGEKLPELCTSTIKLGNSIAVHILEYLSDAKNPRPGFKDVAIEFLETSRALFIANAGLTAASRSGSQLPANVTSDLQELFRQMSMNFTVLNQMVNKLLDNERRQGFGKLGKGFRMMFADTDIEKMKQSLNQCHETSKKNTQLATWALPADNTGIVSSIGYTGLAAVLDRPDPTRSVASAKPSLPALTPDALLEKPPSVHESTLKALASSRGSRQDLPSPHVLEPPSFVRGDSYGTAVSMGSSRETAVSHTFSGRSTGGMTASDNLSDITSPSSMTALEELMLVHEVSDALPKHAVRVTIDPTTVPRWRPQRSTGSIPAGSKTALLVAVQEQNHKVVEHFLDYGVPADNGPECSLLRVAIMNHDLDTVRLLLLFGADSNAKDKDSFTPLFAATEASFFEAAQLLLKYGADPNLSAGPTQETPFALSLRDSKAHFAHLYLKHGANADVLMGNGDTPFIQSMNKSTPSSLVGLMLVYDANPNNKNGRGETALFRAIGADRVDLIKILLEHGADPNLPGPKHMLWPAVHRPKILETLLSGGADLTRAPGVLELATSINSREAVEILLKYGADPNAKKDGIFTPLCTAIRDNHGDLIDLLIAAGADPNLRASEYPAFKCVTHHRAHLLPCILAAGADPNNPKGIIETAVAHGNKDALLILLERNVDVNARNASGHTALTTAIRKNELQFIDILLSYGADPSLHGQEWPVNMAVKNPEILSKLLPHIQTSKIPKGALELAVQADQLESVKLLLAKGVDVEEKNGGVFSALTTSIREDRKAIFQYLLDEAGADPNSPGEHLPIIKAIRRHREDDLSYIKHLLAKGADINLMYRGWNAVLQALDKSDMKTLALMTELATPDLNARDEDGRTVLEIMRERGMQEEERILLGRHSSTPEMKEAFSQLRNFVKQ